MQRLAKYYSVFLRKKPMDSIHIIEGENYKSKDNPIIKFKEQKLFLKKFYLSQRYKRKLELRKVAKIFLKLLLQQILIRSCDKSKRCFYLIQQQFYIKRCYLSHL
ncbi:hypothetical protein TTHERM_000393229 (macronuclear) [Tetrahymena thermophila SB210]|uniref:Uncharacterized protein n=1 Tax=Tetrahymena thermophila (strain SB210) TaxID=312017 RepID=W7XD96_TETTS|nr:hypothetical protein TTHERM_000393229 [Tetrahymena thermophila SB210]EWS75487.1 hypothetical protein TTHERM_000393229 [Tetrahymena thermophila SB210]|eukprot:XP_012651956.1 hypothetical protein TTHERM_000393229 [Tetrahymena thermophila SB210]